MTRPIAIAGLSLYAIGTTLNIVSDTATGIGAWAFGQHLVIPATFFAFGAVARRDWLPVLFAGNGLSALAVAIWTTQQTQTTEFFDPVLAQWFATGNRVWVSPITLEAVRGTAIASGCFGAGLAALYAFQARWFFGSLCFLCGLGLAYVSGVTETRGVLFAVVAGAALVVLRSSWRVKSAAGLIAVGAFACAGMLPERFTDTSVGLTGRWDLWLERIQDILARPCGAGAMADQSGGVSCHNQYLEVAYTYGVLAGAGWLLAVGATAWRCLRSEPWLAACFAALAIHGLTDSHMLSALPVWWFTWMVMGSVWRNEK